MIESYSFGNITIDGKKYTNDVIILDSKIISWWRQEGHLAQVADFADVPDGIEIIVIGTGDSGMMKLDEKVLAHFKGRGIEVVMQMTGEAVNTFNELKQQKKKVAGAFHLTC
jgi:hypothetical protein